MKFDKQIFIYVLIIIIFTLIFILYKYKCNYSDLIKKINKLTLTQC